MAPLTGSACRSCGMFVRHFKSWGLNCSFLDSRSGALLMKSRHISPIRERGNLILSHPDGGRAGFPVGLGQEESLFMETSLLSGPSTDRPPDLIRFLPTRDLGRAIEETHGGFGGSFAAVLTVIFWLKDLSQGLHLTDGPKSCMLRIRERIAFRAEFLIPDLRTIERDESGALGRQTCWSTRLPWTFAGSGGRPDHFQTKGQK